MAVSGAFVSTILIFAPSQVFLTNPREFNCSYIGLIGILILGASLIFIMLFIVNLLVKNRDANQHFVSILLGITFLLWIQGNLLIWNYGLLTGGEITGNIVFIIVDTIVWINLIAIFWLKFKYFAKNAVFLSCLLIAVQIVSISILGYQQRNNLSYSQYEFDYTNEYTFSRRQNVIVLVLDSFESAAFQEIIDEDSSYQDIFNGFTYFPDTLSGFPHTMASIPNILTGQYYDNSIPFTTYLEQAYDSSLSLPKTLKEDGFEVDCFPNWFQEMVPCDEGVVSNIRPKSLFESARIKRIWEVSLFRYAPDLFKGKIYNDGRWLIQDPSPNEQSGASSPTSSFFNNKELTINDLAFADGMMRLATTTDARIFKFFRLDGCHGPYLLNEDLEYEKMPVDDVSYMRQAKGSLQVVDIFLQSLKQRGVFDNSLIVIIGDHGRPRYNTYLDGYRYANPLLLIKLMNSYDEMQISRTPVSSSSIPATVFSELGFKITTEKLSVFESDESAYSSRIFYDYAFDREYWMRDYLPTIKEYVVSGPVREKESWQLSGREFEAGASGN